jgi:flagellar motor protein MotB
MPETQTPGSTDPDMAAPLRFGASGDRPEGGEGATILYLGVFILLLAFFILLNSISHFHEEKVGAVIRSVDDAFSTQALLTGSPGDRQQTRREAARALQDLGDLIRAELPLAKVEAGTETGTLHVTLPAANLFAGDGLTIRPSQQALMDRIARALENRPRGVSVRAEFLFATKGVEDKAPLVARAGALARAVSALGANPAWLSVGLEKGEEAGQLRLLFRVHEEGA